GRDPGISPKPAIGGGSRLLTVTIDISTHGSAPSRTTTTDGPPAGPLTPECPIWRETATGGHPNDGAAARIGELLESVFGVCRRPFPQRSRRAGPRPRQARVPSPGA